MNPDRLLELRSRSCYPAFRGLAAIFTWVGYLIAAGVVCAGVMLMNQGGSAAVLAGLSIIAAAILLVFIVRALQEASLMLADLADAAVAGYTPAPEKEFLAKASTKRCPYCVEEIRAEAIKCKHCGSAVDDAMDGAAIRSLVGR